MASFDAVFAADGVQVVKTPGPGSSCKRVCRALGAQRPGRVPGLDPDLEPSPSRTGVTAYVAHYKTAPATPGHWSRGPVALDKLPTGNGHD